MATVYPFRQSKHALTGVHARCGPARFFDPSFLVSPPPPSHTASHLSHDFISQEITTRLRQFEATAQQKFFLAIEDMTDMNLEHWFRHRMDHQFIPALTRIGFDETFARALFQTASSSWQRMGPFTDQCIWFYPDLIRNLKALRGKMMPQAESETCWIILPRVYRFLEEEHCACLWGYLHHLAGEPASEFRRILTRIIIEFIGNYTLKYRSRVVPACRTDAALFYGYEAMFWKNLRKPPPGFEDDLIFDHCLRWIKLFRSRCAEFNDDMDQSVRQMESQRQKVMLAEGAGAATGDDRDNPDLARLMVTLRHGRPGMAAATKFMGSWIGSCEQNIAGPRAYALLPAAICRLLHIINCKLPAESPEAQTALRHFLGRLKESFASVVNSNQTPQQFRFIARRLLGLVAAALV